MLAKEWDRAVAIAKDQVRHGAHAIDLCVDYTGADGVADMDELAGRCATQVSLPLVLDSTEADVIEAGLTHIGGRPIINSVNLEDGSEPGTRLDRFLRLASEYGSAVVCTCIDETGQARTGKWKLRAAEAIAKLAVERYGLAYEDLLIDPLVLPISTGMQESRRDGLETLEGIRLIKRAMPGVSTIIGLSNVSFGLNPAARRVLNSVFLAEAIKAGLDAAIVNPAGILPLSQIDPEHLRVCLDLIYDRRSADYDPLADLLRLFEGVESKGDSRREDRTDWPLERLLSQRIVDGDQQGLQEDLERALELGHDPLSIINEMLLEGMKTVGDLFGSGQMQLPFVLASAETMKAAVSYLETKMEKAERSGKGRLVLATVKGDVHDIGKNLVDIILSNNGYEVFNLGIKIPIGEIVAKASEVGADAIGMSGLLVKSTLIMRENLEELNARSLSHIPVILGGAALNRTYVERDLRQVYKGPLFYGKDAFEGLSTMDQIVKAKATGGFPPDFGRQIRQSSVRSRLQDDSVGRSDISDTRRSESVQTDNQIFQPPFIGSRVAKGLALDEIAAYLNETALYRNQWGYRPSANESDDQFKLRVREILREQLQLVKEGNILVPQVVWGYFPANSDGNALIVFKDEDRRVEWLRFSLPRQSVEPRLCIADFFRPVTSGEPDWVGMHIVTMGQRVSQVAADLFARNEYRRYLLLHGLGVEMTEALAEYWHHRIRAEWGFVAEDGPTLTGLFRQKYRGGRYSFGYPACPDLAGNVQIAELLDATRIGVTTTEEMQYEPEQTTSAIICHHPQAKYFVVR
jgi:5-methyltetrahydrofolate--homocysteine methyltransferase